MMDYSSRQGYYAIGRRFDQPPGVKGLYRADRFVIENES